MPKKNPAPGAAPAPKAERFQHLVSSMAAAARSEALFSASAPQPASPEMDAAWRRLISPQRVAGLALMAESRSDYLFSEYYRNSVRDMNARVFPLLSDADCALLAPALLQCAQDIQAAASSEAFSRSAALHAPLIAAPSGNEESPSLSFPFMGLALRPSKALVDGKRAPSLSASWLAQAGDADMVETSSRQFHHHRQGQRMTAEAWLAPAGLQGADLADTAAALNAVREVMPETREYNDDKPASTRRFAAVLAPADGSPAFSGDLPLPRVGLIRKSLQETGWRTVARLGAAGELDASLKRAELPGMKSKTALQALSHMAKGALALSLSRADGSRLLGNELSDRLSLSEGALAQAMPLINSAEGALYRHYDLPRKLLGDSRFLHDQYRENFPAAPTDEAIDAFLAPAYEQSAKPSAEALDFKPLGGKGRGLQGLAHALESADPRLGLIQWAAGAFEAVKSVHHYQENLQRSEQNPDRYSRGQEPITPMSANRSALVGAIEAVRQAMKGSTRAFTETALAEAERVERAWLAKRGLAQAWSQAEMGGEITSKTLAWAAANPALDLLASEDPMLNLGARVAKAWGLRVESPLDEAAFSQRFEAALEEMGAGSEAQAALLASDRLRGQIASLSRVIASNDKDESALAKTALSFTLRLAQRAALLGLPAQDIAELCQAYADLEPKSDRFGDVSPASRLAHFNARSWDQLGPELGEAHLSSVASAQLIKELNTGKAAHYNLFLDALAHDWRETLEASAKASDLGGKAPGEIARARAKEIIELYPAMSHQALDWRKPIFDAPVWSVLGSVSPRFSAARLSARSQGELGAWCARVARGLGIRDAADGNDLIGKTREAIKAASGLSDGAWKQMIKTPEALRRLGDAMGLDSEYSRRHGSDHGQSSPDPSAFLPPQDQAALDSARRSAPDPAGARYGHYGYERREPAAIKADGDNAARLFTAAARLNLSMPATLAAADALLERPELFSLASKPARASGADGADFYLKETQAKIDRAPYLIKEAAKRFEKFQRDALTPPPEGQIALDPLKALAEEAIDLADWIGQSEAGVWQTLPEQPTWGQLRRASAEWHAEQAAMQRDRIERQQAKEQRERAAREARRDAPARPAPALGQAPVFEATSAERAKEAAKPKLLMGDFGGATGAGWPKILGRHARDGWQAVELLTAAELSEEGNAMSHCVSTYSGQCRAGDTRIFSILLNDERVCTVQISAKGGNLSRLDEKASFHIVQNKGKANRSVTAKAAVDFCEETRAMVEASWSSMCLKRKAALELEARRAAKAEEERRAAHKAHLLGLPAEPSASASEPAPAPAGVGEKLKARRSAKPAKAKDAPAAG